LIQTAILILSGLAIWLATTKQPVYRLIGGCIGLIGQSFWLYETFVKIQWGMFLLSIWFLIIYVKTIIVACKDRRQS